MKRVLRYVLGTCFLLSATGCITTQGQGITQPAPGITHDPYFWDFGKVKKGKTAVHTFIIKNNASKSLSVKTVNTSCGCAVTRVGNTHIPPGESTFLEVAFDSRDYSGIVQQYIYVHTDDPDDPILRFIIKADVI